MMRTRRGHPVDPWIVDVVILFGLSILFHYLIPVMIVISQPYSYLGAVLMLLGFGLMTWTAILFRNEGTSFKLREGSFTLVTSGPFGFSRNPMYLGMLIWLVGLAVLLGSLIVFLFPILFFLISNLLIIPLEERKMVRLMTTRYIEYRKNVRRWL